MVIKEFLDPKAKIKLHKDENGNLYYEKSKRRVVYINNNGSYDFVSRDDSATEKDHYDTKYSETKSRRLTLQDLSQKWYDKSFPENLALLESLGKLSNKKILLLGNGTSFKELYFLYLGAKIVYTDLSIEAVKHMKKLFSCSKLKQVGNGNIEFHAVDASYLPFPDDSFDIIYGYAFVHHIEDLDLLFSEISRCLKKNGICRFLDSAYSPIWYFTKKLFLKPLQVYSHIKGGISPADLRATRKGGYKRDEIFQIMQKFGFKELVFKRISFFQLLWRRMVTKLFKGNNVLIRKGTPVMTSLDNFLTKRFHLMKRNLLGLIWGFNK